MPKIKLNWITGKRLIERWNLDIRELQICIQSGLPVYNPDFELEEFGPYCVNIPNPDYIQDDVYYDKYKINKNNLYDLQVFLDSPSTAVGTGLTKDEILNNLLFKMEDVERFEAKHGKDIKDLPDDNDQKSEFAIYESIVNGELRPFLEIYSSKNHIEKLLKELWTLSFFKDEDGNIQPISEHNEFYDVIVKPGDELEFSFDEKDDQTKPTLTNITSDINGSVEELFYLGIPPPPDIKAEFFLDLIATENKKIGFRAKKVLETSSSEEQISLFANKNIQILKEIAGQAHTLSKRVKPKVTDKWKDPWDDPDFYIIGILKKYIVHSILFYQELFQPYLKVPPQDEFELKTSLYGARHPTDIIRRSDKRRRNELYKNLGVEIQTFKKRDDTKLDPSITTLKILTLTEKWLSTVSKEAVSNGFIGKSHLVFIMASDENYTKNLILIQLVENMFSEMKERKDPYLGFSELSTSDFKSRIDVWHELFKFWTNGNYPWERQLYDKYLPLYCIDENTKELEKIDLREKYDQLAHKALKGERSDLAFEERIEINKFMDKLAKFIKLSELKKYFVDVMGIPLPSLLIAESTQADWDIEKNTEKTIHIPSAPDQNETTEIKADDFVRNLRVSYESDNKVKIKTPHKKAKVFTYDELGFKDNEVWKAFIYTIKKPPHIYETGPSSIKKSGEKERIKQYDTKMGRIRSINKKLINFFNKEYGAQLPKTFKSLNIRKEEGGGKYKFEFQVLSDDGIEEDYRSIYEQLPDDQLINEVEKLHKKHSVSYDQIVSERFVVAFKVATEKNLLSDDKVKKMFPSDLKWTSWKKEYSKGDIRDDDLHEI